MKNNNLEIGTVFFRNLLRDNEKSIVFCGQLIIEKGNVPISLKIAF